MYREWKKITRLRGRPRNRWQVKVREDGRVVGGEECQEKVYNRGIDFFIAIILLAALWRWGRLSL
jgi:hypothetical protein